MRNGILVGGNWIIDQVKVIDSYPLEEQLVNINKEYTSNGGAAYNVLKNLFKMQVSFPLEGVGLVGDDARGSKILEECRSMSINVNQIRKTDKAATSYTDVMSVESTGKRTFFHHRGANALLDESYFDFSDSPAKIFHLGYLLLLDKLDEIGSDGTTGASRVFKEGKKHGFITSADIVSESSDRFKEIIPVSLPYIDFLFINEFEAKMLTGIDPLDEQGELSIEKCYQAAEEIINKGVRQWAILHFPQGVLAVSRDKNRLFQPSINLSARHIVGAVGAGDALAAGVLTGIHEGWSMRESLELGVCTAASSLFAATSSDSVVSYTECLAIAKQYGYRESYLKCNKNKHS